MTKEQLLKNLSVPVGPVDVVIDSDAAAEIDDQYAISYLLRSKEKLNTKALYAAPVSDERIKTPKIGMEKSYNEILNILSILKEDIPVFSGSYEYLKDEKTPVISDAARDLANRAATYSPDKPLYIIGIGAITNIASAILLNPSIVDNVVIVWLGGHSYEYKDTNEYNMCQDFAAARVVMSCGAPFVQLPCFGVVSSFSLSKSEIEFWLSGKNEICDYLSEITVTAAEKYAKGKPWTRIIWDVAPVAWLLNDNDKFMQSRIVNTRIPDYNGVYGPPCEALQSRYVYYINRDALMNDLIKKLIK